MSHRCHANVPGGTCNHASFFKRSKSKTGWSRDDIEPRRLGRCDHSGDNLLSDIEYGVYVHAVGESIPFSPSIPAPSCILPVPPFLSGKSWRVDVEDHTCVFRVRAPSETVSLC
jgi:hypothetical protein